MQNIPMRAPLRNAEFIFIILKMYSNLFAITLQKSKIKNVIES